MIAPGAKESGNWNQELGQSCEEPDHAVLVGRSEKCLKLRAEKAAGGRSALPRLFWWELLKDKSTEGNTENGSKACKVSEEAKTLSGSFCST